MNSPDRATAYGPRLLGMVLAGALLAAVGSLAVGLALDLLGSISGSRQTAAGYREYLSAGGWLRVPLWGAAFGALRALFWAPSRARRLWTGAAFLALVLLPFAVRPAVVGSDVELDPRTPRAKARAILKWSYRSPATVARIVSLSRDPDPRVREQAVLAMGVNLVVSDIERASPSRPARYANQPVRDSLRARLLEVLADDSVEAVRAEAARALWNAPVTFGRQPAAAETLSMVLGRALEPGAVERLAWLALDAAAGARDSGLKAAAARFAAATPDTELARAARIAVAR